ncbi:MAG: TonB-dependent receptor [Alphaproteobacteria bacterium]|nr:TonB-dependent receptor [Alphaproteobacteria bacterium]
MRKLLMLALGVAAAHPALAQLATPVDVIVVTGIGPARSSDELIASTTVLDQEAIVERLDRGLGDTLAGLPGISSTSFGPGASRPIIRGLGAERVQVLTNGIGVIDASAASPDHAVLADPLGAERIEILRGPAALAYGGGATGGVVNVIDGLIVETLPERALSGQLYGGLTSADEGQQAAGRMTASAGGFVGVLHGSYLDADEVDIPGFALSETARAAVIADGGPDEPFASESLPNSAVENQGLSGGLSWVGDSAFIGAAVRRTENAYGIVGEVGPYIDMEQTRYDARGGLNFETGIIRSLKASASVADYEHTEFESPGEPGAAFANDGVEGRIEFQHAPIREFEGSIGVQASERDFAATGDESFITLTNTRQAGVFIYEAYERERWGLEGGLRYDNVKVDNVVGGERSFEAFNASFGGHAHLTEQLFLGASVSRTERAPTDVELFANGPHLATGQFEVGDSAIGTETGVTAEASIRWEAGPLSIEGSVYRYDFDGFIYLRDTGVVTPGPDGDLPVFQFSQQDANFTGGEVTATAQLGIVAGIDMQADGSVDIVRAEFEAGGNLPFIPPATISAGLEGRRGVLSGRLGAQYGFEQDRVAPFETPTGDFLTVDARMAFELSPSLQLILEGRNLSDEDVRIHASPLKEVAPQPGRNFRVALLARF